MRAADAPQLAPTRVGRTLPGAVSTAWRAADAWLFARGTARRLAGVRIGLCAVLAERLGRGVYTELAVQPHALFRPVSFMRLLGGMPARGVVVALQVTGVAAATLATVGLRTRVALPVAWTCALFLNGMATSAGKVVHNDVLLLLALVPLLFAPVADRWSVDAALARRRGPILGPETSPRYGWPIGASMAVIAGVYFLIGLNKLILSGPAWVLSGNLRWILYASSDAHPVPNGFALFIADRPVLARVVAVAALGVEVGFPLALFLRRLRPVVVAGAVALHLGIMVAMGLDYTPWIAADVVVFVDWPRVVDRLKGHSATAGQEGPAP